MWIGAVGLMALHLLAAPDAAGLRAQAAQAYHARRYAEACAKFASAAKLAPKDGAIQADLGLCLQRLGKRAEAIAANRRAVALGDETTRQNAYYNLGQLEDKVALPATGNCGPLHMPGCERTWYTCTYEWVQESVGGQAFGLGVRVASSEALAQGSGSEPEQPPSLFDLEDKKSLRFPQVEMPLTVKLEDHCRCQGTPRERARCEQQCGKYQESTECFVVHVDPCQHRVGAFCTLRVNGKRQRSMAREYTITE